MVTSEVQYIFVEPTRELRVSFQVHAANVAHYDYESLYEEIKSNCPVGYACVVPVALFHEVVWDGNGATDVLHHAVEQAEYARIDWAGRSVFVDVVKQGSGSMALMSMFRV